MKRDGFTLVEILVILSVIALLTAITLAVLPGIFGNAAKSRATAEIRAMETALESFKTEMGNYPPGNASGYNPSAYVPAATSLFTNLCGRNAFSDTPTGRSYMEFKRNQLGTSGTFSYVQDPYGYAYGYCLNGPMNSGMFDLWSTAGKTDNAASSTNQWITNWQSR